MTQVATNYVREFQSVEVDATNKPGGWTPVKPTDPHVIEIGKFAVAKHNEQAHTHLVFVKVTEAWEQIVIEEWQQIVKYRLIIEAWDNKWPIIPPLPPQLYEAVVYEALPSGKKELISFG